jgi:cytoskeleton protein RodZ
MPKRGILLGSLERNVEEAAPENAEFTFQTVGEQLKAERERRGWTIDEVATRTRIPIRHLESIEKSNFSKIPGTTYALGFARSYARAMDMDEVKLGTSLRVELAEAGQSSYPAPSQNYEPADPSSVPSKMLAWTAAAVGVLVIAGYFLFRSFSLDSAPADLATPVTATQPGDNISGSSVPATNMPAAAPATGDVVLTATGVVWIKIYDADKKRLFESEMKIGDTYTVPADANGPMIVTGRPDLITLTVGGKAVAPLGTGERTIADIGISAKALSERPATAATTPPPGAQSNPLPANQ